MVMPPPGGDLRRLRPNVGRVVEDAAADVADPDADADVADPEADADADADKGGKSAS